MTNLKIGSLNCQGLGNIKKRRDVFQYLRQKQYSIYLLQDTHFESKVERQIRSEWGYECFFASYNSQSRGVAVLMNNNFDFKVNKVIKDALGNFIIIKLKLNSIDKEIVLLNVYGPNKDDPDFYQKIKKHIVELGNLSNLILAGDWNLVLNPTLDYQNYRSLYNKKAQEKVIEMMADLEVCDIWREINPELLRYTWRRTNPKQQSRLDFFLVSENLVSNIKEADILYGYRSDHSLITINLQLKKEECHKNLWKFNSSLLKDPQYAVNIKETIKQVKDQYAATPYSRENFEQTQNQELQLTISDQLFLHVLLMEIRKKKDDYLWQ